MLRRKARRCPSILDALSLEAYTLASTSYPGFILVVHLSSVPLYMNVY